ncbi:MAG: 3'(2'),5'-bisphosphate nucleotidase CysQ [Stappiaceae bacterium]
MDADPTDEVDLHADLELIVSAARAGGKVALEYFGKNPDVQFKENNSPVSEADFAVDRTLADLLQQERPDYGWLSEETADTEERLDKETIFVVDPIDGTRVFLAGEDVWTICIAVVRKHRPVSAVVYAPARGEMYTAIIGKGARLGEAELQASAHETLASARVAGPKSFAGNSVLRREKVVAEDYIGSLAYRVTMVAAGQLEGAFARARPHDWDLAAADLLVHEAGGRLTDLQGRPLRYNRANTRHPALLAAPVDLHHTMTDIARQTVL